MDLNYDLIGIQIQKHREQKRLSQADLGDIIDSTERHVRRIEGGHCGVSLNLFVAIANVLNASADDLLNSNLTHTQSSTDAEIMVLIHDCIPAEKAILMDMLRHMKKLLQEHGI